MSNLNNMLAGDNMHIFYEGDGKYGIPFIEQGDILIPDHLVQYRHGDRYDVTSERAATHYFIDDFRFQSVWTHPHRSMEKIKNRKTTLTPDFSMCYDWPIALQMWNKYRNHWCGVFWLTHGFDVIPTAGWTDERSYEWCFSGTQKGSVVAVGLTGIKQDPVAVKMFKTGYKKMCEVIEPSFVLCYGDLYNELKGLATAIEYPLRWKGLRKPDDVREDITESEINEILIGKQKPIIHKQPSKVFALSAPIKKEPEVKKKIKPIIIVKK